MDFGDILDQWDSQQKNAAKKQKESGKTQISHKKANAPTPAEKAAASSRATDHDFDKRINPEEAWLRRYGTVDKDKIAEEAEESMRTNSQQYFKSLPVEARLDLHGLTQDEARSRLNSFISDCLKRGVRKVLLIHGKGLHTTGSDPVLGEVVRKFMETDKRCGMSGHPEKRMGGNGATWLVLKQ
ncbi:MAG: Smr/MutS family protein [Treponema sp.]|nr:Smr/MutS family protein [Treponema sp.]